MTGELRAIPFIGGKRYRIDREGRLYQERICAKGRQRRFPSWSRIDGLTLTAAKLLARRSLRFPFELTGPSSIVREGVAEPFLAVECVLFDLHAPTDRAAYRSGELRAVGDLNTGWYRIDRADGRALLFHGPSLAAEIFEGSD